MISQHRQIASAYTLLLMIGTMRAQSLMAQTGTVPHTPSNMNFSIDIQDEQKHQTFQFLNQTVDGAIENISAAARATWKSKCAAHHAEWQIAGHLILENDTFDQLDPNLSEDDFLALKTIAITPIRTSGQITLATALISSGIQWQLTEATTVGFSLGYTGVVPDAKVNKRADQPTLFGQYQLKDGSLRLSASSGILQTLDEPHGMHQTETRATMSGSYEIISDVFVSAEAKFAQFAYNNVATNGPNEHATVTGGMAALFPLHITIGAKFTANHDHAFRWYGLPAYASLSFDEDASQQILFASIAPVSWLSGEMRGTGITRSFSHLNVVDPEGLTELKQSRPHDIREFQLLIKAGTTF